MPVAQVHLVVEQAQVVGAHVEHHRDHPAGVDPGGGDVDGQLADGDLDPADAPVADAEDPLGVGGHDQVDVVGAEAVVAERLLDQVRVVHRQEHAPGTAVLVAVPLDRLADRRGVDDRQHVPQVLRQQPVEQDLVAVAQVGQVHVLGQLVRLPLVLGMDPADLPVDRRHPVGQQADQPERPPLLGRERGPPVEHRRPQDREPAGPHPQHRPLGRGHELVRSLAHAASCQERVPANSSRRRARRATGRSTRRATDSPGAGSGRRSRAAGRRRGWPARPGGPCQGTPCGRRRRRRPARRTRGRPGRRPAGGRR